MHSHGSIQVLDMGNLKSHLSEMYLSGPTDEFYHLQRPISVLHLRVDPQQIQAFELAPNDEMELQLPHDQSIELIVRDRNAQPLSDLTQILESSIPFKSHPAQNTLAQLQQKDRVALKLRQQMTQLNIQDTDLEKVICLEYAPSIQFKALAALEIIVLNTGKNMQIEQQTPVDEAKVILKKAIAALEYLPAPLAQPIQDIRIARASAQTYTVKAGQWTQLS